MRGATAKIDFSVHLALKEVVADVQRVDHRCNANEQDDAVQREFEDEHGEEGDERNPPSPAPRGARQERSREKRATHAWHAVWCADMAEAAAEGQPRKQEAMQHLIKSLAHNGAASVAEIHRPISL